MNFFDIPYLVEFFFGFSTIVFLITLFAILPAVLFNKRTVFKPLLISSVLYRAFNYFLDKDDTLKHTIKEGDKIALIARSD